MKFLFAKGEYHTRTPAHAPSMVAARFCKPWHTDKMNRPELLPTPTSYQPLMSRASAGLTHEVDAVDERGRRSTLHIPAERPLTV